MKKILKNTIVVAFVALLSGGFNEVFAQADDATVLKALILKKFDANRDQTLTGLEKDGAVGFLRRVDRNGDSKISDIERAKAIEALKQMPDPKVVSKPASEPATLSGVMRGRASGAKGQSTEGVVIREGEIPKIKIIPRPTADTIGKKREKLEEVQKMKDVRRREAVVDPALLAARAQAKASPPKKKNYYDGNTIISTSGIHTVVPQGSVIYVPPDLAGMIVKQPVGKLMRWPEFRDKYSKWIKTRKVSWETAKGEDPIKGPEREAFAEGNKLIIAVFGKSPITVLEPPPEKEEEDITVEGAVSSDSKKKKK